MKKYILNQLTQVSAWIGIILILAAGFAPREYIVALGIFLVLTDDESLKKWLANRSPAISKFFEDLTS